LTFTINEATKILQDDSSKTLADIKEGDNVTVEYIRQDAETRVATKVTINPPAQ
jgi:hypothetical protein